MHYYEISAILLTFVCGSFSQIHVTVPELIRMSGYPCEEHFVTTEDGYVLAMHRIPYGKDGKGKGQNRKPLIMQHGLFSSSASWVLNISHESPGYIMSDAGYDVWLTNARGSVYSKRNRNLNPKSYDFWNFSWDEMARYDLPKFIDYILGHTKHQQLYYIGHSMGTTIFFAGMSIKPEYNAKVKKMVGLAPVGTVTHINTWFKYLSTFQTPISNFLRFIGDYEIIPTSSSKFTKFIHYICTCSFWTTTSCKNFLFMIVGFDDSEFDDKWMAAVDDELLSGTSLNTVMHYAQEYKAGRFQHFDHGSKKNQEIYGQIVPPEYNLSNVTSPVHLVWGMNDYLADDQDVQFLVKNLPNVRSRYVVPYKQFNHLDFLWAKDLKSLVYEPVIQMLASD